MNIELTDARRYELELDNCLAVILAANRAGIEFDEEDLAATLNISQEMVDKLILQLQADGHIK